MATTSPDNLRTPDSGDSYALVQDMGILADTTQNALIKRANAYVGTTAQRVAFSTDAPMGTIWSDTDGERLVWKKGATGWEPIVEPPINRVVRSGRQSISSGALTLIPNSGGVYGKTLTYTLPFPLTEDETVVTVPEYVGNGFGIVSQNNVTSQESSTKVVFRFLQVASSAAQTVRVIWQVVKV